MLPKFSHIIEGQSGAAEMPPNWNLLYLKQELNKRCTLSQCIWQTEGIIVQYCTR